ncbi:MAG: aspartate aminotransferase family protein [Bacteroidales bacterium]|nr:aspartate aminotransferase family protein [Bacteroidales bacterium]
MDKGDLINLVFEKVKEYLEKNNDNTIPVVKYIEPQSLAEEVQAEVGELPLSGKEFLEYADKYFEYAVRTGNKQFFNQLYSGFNLPAFLGELITIATNTSMYTYEVAPVATVIEKEMISLMNSYAGYDSGDGIFLTGGSNANLVAMFSARNRIFPEVRFEGYNRHMKLRVFINEQAHYSIETAANLLGLGSDSVIKVKADDRGRIIPSELENEINNSLKRGEKPFFVVATSGTTLLGAYDPLNEISEICRRYDLWLHADGSFGGSVLISEQHRSLMDGIEKTDSLAWNPHKLMNIPLTCSVLLVRDETTLYRNFTDINTDYIYHDIEEVDDLGKKSIQCGRRVDAVKLWFAWKYYGKEGYRDRIDNSMAMAAYAEQKVKDMPELELMVPRNSFTVCFRYVAKNIDKLNEFNLELREELRKSGKTIVNYGYNGKDLAIRLVTSNGELEKKDIDLFFEYMAEEGRKLNSDSKNTGSL